MLWALLVNSCMILLKNNYKMIWEFLGTWRLHGVILKKKRIQTELSKSLLMLIGLNPKQIWSQQQGVEHSSGTT